MRVSNIKNSYSVRFGKSDSEFFQAKITEKVSPLNSVDIIEDIMNDIESSSLNNERNKLFFKIGKIFENAGSLNNARAFYEKVKCNLSSNDAQKCQNIDFDIKRVNQKELEKYTRGWEV